MIAKRIMTNGGETDINKRKKYSAIKVLQSSR